MRKQKLVIPFLALLTLIAFSLQACTGSEAIIRVVPETEVETALPTPTPEVVEVATATATPSKVEAVEESEAVVEAEVEDVKAEVDPPAATEIEEAPETVAVEPTQAPLTPTSEPEVTTAPSEPFTATTGLDLFSSYRMNLTGDFDGTRQGQPSSGTLDGLLEATKNPKAQHLRIDMDGDTFSSLAPLGKIEVYDVNSTFYIQNPQNGSWLTLPAFLIHTMLPNGVPSPEDSIDLPVTAVPQPGTEIVNGIVTRRYTFGPDDLAAEHQSKYDDVEGTIWVAVEGDYVVRYEAIISGQFGDLVAEAEANSGQFGGLLGGDLSMIDEGTITMRYELSDINSNFSIKPPEGVGGFNLGGFLFN